MADNSKKKENRKVKKSFLKDVKAELKKVTWPTTKQVVNNTAGVIVMVIITAIIVLALDFTFKNFNDYVIKGVKVEVSKISDKNTVSLDNTTSTKNNENTVSENNNVVDNEDTGNEIITNTISE